jgi:hypothetical protein
LNDLAGEFGSAANAHLTASQNDTREGRVLKVGDFGLGSTASNSVNDANKADSVGFYTGSGGGAINFNGIGAGAYGTLLVERRNGVIYQTNTFNQAVARRYSGDGGVTWSDWVEQWDESNTAVDGSGFIKEASPIIKLFADRVEFNAQCPDDAEFEKVSTGHYLIRNTLGFAQQGWYIENPKDANGNVKVFVEYEQLADNTLEIKTFEPNHSTGKITGGEPADIPETRWIDLRLEAEPVEVVDGALGI